MSEVTLDRLRQGDCVLFHGRLLHTGSKPADLGAFRHVVASHYIPKSYGFWPPSWVTDVRSMCLAPRRDLAPHQDLAPLTPASRASGAPGSYWPPIFVFVSLCCHFPSTGLYLYRSIFYYCKLLLSELSAYQ
jgi:hypothetical protein